MKNDFGISDLRQNSKMDIEVLNRINKHLVDMGSTSISTASPNTTIEINQNSMFFRPVTKEEVRDIFQSLKETKSVGVDEVPVILLKTCSNILSKPLAHLINLSMDTTTFTDFLKCSMVKLIFKKGKRGKLIIIERSPSFL